MNEVLAEDAMGPKAIINLRGTILITSVSNLSMLDD